MFSVFLESLCFSSSDQPEIYDISRFGSKLDPYREKIRALIDDHNLSAVRILEEIRKIGYDGESPIEGECIDMHPYDVLGGYVSCEFHITHS